MRIVGGRLRGRAIAGPAGDGGAARLRPTSDRMREAVFNMLVHGDYPALEGARVLDLFAGTGALGCEALSRGAARAVFVDEGAEARALIRRNIETLELIGETRLYRRDATKLGVNRAEPFDLVFLDPPYGRGLAVRAIESARDGGWIAPGAVLLCETSADEAFVAPDGFAEVDARQYGAGIMRFLRAPSSAFDQGVDDG